MTFESRHTGNRKSGSGMMIRMALMAVLLVAFALMMRKLKVFGNGEVDTAVHDLSTVPYYWPESAFPVIHHSTFTLAYDEDHEQARWVAYILTRDELNRHSVGRTDWFEADESVPSGSADYYDYKGSGMTKGHLLPSADRAWSRDVNAETFLMSNISPQTYYFNGGVWRELEENVRDWARDNERLYIVTGPIIGNSHITIGDNDVTVPESFFKVILDLDMPDQKAIGFIIPNEKTNRPLYDFVMTVDQIESVTGIDFYDQLITDDDLEEDLETVTNNEEWPIDPGRYRTRIEKWNK